jgi:CO/xanthine dehydrogenase Mo-binding subunit
MKKRGVGISLVFYPVGMFGGGDTTQAVIKLKPDGGADLFVGTCDIGQGVRTILAQIVSQELGIPFDQIVIHNQDTDVAGICTGTFASRGTYFAGNAVKNAAADAREKLLALAEESLGVPPEYMTVGDGQISVSASCPLNVVRGGGCEKTSVAIADICAKTNWQMGQIIVGVGYFWKQPSTFVDEENGQIDPLNTISYGASMAEVEVDTLTGEVDILKMVNVFDVGKVLNPLQTRGQIDGGMVMGIGATMMEDLFPNYPSIEQKPNTLADYIIPTAADVPEMESYICEFPSTKGPYGAKGLGEMTNNTASPAIVSAIHDAVGIWINNMPVSPEKILRALDEKAQ